jgi:hypothetical protein
VPNRITLFEEKVKLRELLAVLPRRHPFDFGKAGAEIRNMIEANLFGDGGGSGCNGYASFVGEASKTDGTTNPSVH